MTSSLQANYAGSSTRFNFTIQQLSECSQAQLLPVTEAALLCQDILADQAC